MAGYDTSLLQIDIKEIINATNPNTDNLQYSLILHTPEEDYTVPIVKLIEVMRNYNKYVGDYIVVTFYMPAGDFIKGMYKYRDNMELTIVQTDKYDTSFVKSTRYKFVLLNNNKNVYGSNYAIQTKEELNKHEMLKIEGQCIDRVVEGMRLLQVEGIYENVTIKDLITAELTEKLEGLAVDGNAESVRIDIEEPNNPATIKQIILPTGVYALDFPSYLQNSIYGVYNNGLGTYVQDWYDNKTLFVYPLFDVNRVNNREYRLIIYYTSAVKFNYIDNTYFLDGSTLKIIAGTTLRSLDDAENEFINSGDGYIRTKPQQIMNRNVMVGNDKLTLDNTTQVEGTKFKERRDGVSRARYVGPEVNMYKHRTYVNRQTMGMYEFTWYYSNPDLIYPGMPLLYLFEDSAGVISQLEGAVQLVCTVWDAAKNTRSSLITFFARKPVTLSEKESSSS